MIEKEFRKWIDEEKWFYNSLMNDSISLWNFNLFVFSNLKYSYLAVKSDNTEIIKELKKLKYIIIDNYRGITLLQKEVRHL